MTYKINDWEFDIYWDLTTEHSSLASQVHCTCGYCMNYYEAVELCYPKMRKFIASFGSHVDGPVEMYPIQPTMYLAGYRIFGKILKAGIEPMMVDGVPIMAEVRDDEKFMLEVGEMELPWVLDEDMSEVVSPANEPEFLEKMYKKMLSRSSGTYFLLS